MWKLIVLLLLGFNIRVSKLRLQAVFKKCDIVKLKKCLTSSYLLNKLWF